MKTEPHFRIIEKQAFIAAVPMYLQNADGTRTPISAAALSDLQVKVSIKNGAEVHTYNVGVDLFNNILLDFPHGIDKQVYSVEVNAQLGGRPIRSYYSEAFEGVGLNRDTTFENFVTGSQINMPDSVFVLSADTSAIADIQARLEQAVADAQAAKEEWERKAAELDDVAQESTSQEIKELVLQEGIEHAHEYAQEINAIIGDWTNE